ncbi:acyltransferase family protein [Agromyces silvae]|uniref:acyltransferase family protein n=1 Tax=Agromyces silvae TaxID=3388266 RepID=UPI00280A6570|nr:acyltransferase family protein [Agromyces protaetiae]
MPTLFRGDIQGLRALAVLLVLLYHSGVSVLSGGYVGVDVFFVISGFLITSHIWREIDQTGRLRFAQFYARRARRILPASFAVLILSVAAALIWLPPLQHPAMLQAAAATAAYVPNVLFAAQGTNYLAETAPSVFQHYWSLGIEEQFYLIWPLLMLAAFVLTRRSYRGLLITLVILVIGSFALSIIATGVSQPIAFFMLPTRAWELGVGGLLALLVARAPHWLSLPGVPLVGWLGLGMIAASALVFTSSTPFPGWQAAIPVLGTALVILAGSGRSTRLGPARSLSVRPALFLGAISYSLYLVHWPLLVIPQEAIGLSAPLPSWLTLSLGALAIPLAWLSWRFIEEPFRKSGRAAKRPARHSLLTALGASAGVVVLALGGAVAAQGQPLTSGSVAPAAEVTTQPDGTDHVPANMRPTLRSAEHDNPVVYENGCHRESGSSDPAGCMVGDNGDAPLVALFGDSHAAQWYPALARLAESGTIRLDSNSKSRCASASLPEPAYASCSTWRQGVIDRLADTAPDIVILANYASAQVAGSPDPGTEWRDALATTVGKLHESSHVVVMADSPHGRATPAICLSAHLDNASACALPRSDALDEATRAAEASVPETTYVDLTEYFCNEDVCPTVIGDTLVYRDAHHLTATFSASLSAVLEEAIEPILERSALAE